MRLKFTYLHILPDTFSSRHVFFPLIFRGKTLHCGIPFFHVEAFGGLYFSGNFWKCFLKNLPEILIRAKVCRGGAVSHKGATCLRHVSHKKMFSRQMSRHVATFLFIYFRQVSPGMSRHPDQQQKIHPAKKNLIQPGGLHNTNHDFMLCPGLHMLNISEYFEYME